MTAPYQGNTREDVNAFALGTTHYSWTPELVWQRRVKATDLNTIPGVSTVITIPASGMTSGRLSVTLNGVTVTADAAVGDANTALATALNGAMTTAIAGDLAGIISSSSVSSNAVTIVWAAGVEREIAVSFDPAQVVGTTFGGTTLIDGDYVFTLSGGGLDAPVVVPVERGGSVTTVAQLAVAAETALEALIATSLAGVLVSADDDGTDGNTLQFEPGIADVTVTLATPGQVIETTFGGTPTDGDYDHIFEHASLPGAVRVRTTRSAGTPATNAALATQAEADIEAQAQLMSLVESADDDGAGVCAITTFAGVSGLTVTLAAPSPGTLVQADVGPTLVQADETPAGPTVTLGYAFDLNAMVPTDPFLEESIRGEATLQVDVAFPAGSTATLDDAGGASTDVLDEVAIDAVGEVGDSGTSLGDQDQALGSWSPRLVVTLPGTSVPSVGQLTVNVVFSPLPK